MGGLELLKKKVFALYMLQFKRFRWSRQLGPNGAKQSSKLKPWASKVELFEICMDSGKLAFLMFFRSAKRRAKITNKSTFGRQDGPGNVISDAI